MNLKRAKSEQPADAKRSTISISVKSMRAKFSASVDCLYLSCYFLWYSWIWMIWSRFSSVLLMNLFNTLKSPRVAADSYCSCSCLLMWKSLMELTAASLLACSLTFRSRCSIDSKLDVKTRTYFCGTPLKIWLESRSTDSHQKMQSQQVGHKANIHLALSLRIRIVH